MKTLTQTITLMLAAGLLTSACAKEKHKAVPVLPKNQNSNDKTRKNCPTEKDLAVDTSLPIVTESLTLTTKYQQVIRRDCKKIVKSNKVEQVDNDNTAFSFLSQNKIINKDHRSTSFNNRSTCRTGESNSLSDLIHAIKPKSDSAVSEVQMVVGLKTRFMTNNIKVQVGQNVIDYKLLGACPESVKTDPQSDICESKMRPTLEQGTVILNVKHEIKTLPGELVIDEECPNAKPK